MSFIGFGKTGQFRNVVKQVMVDTTFTGLDENGKLIKSEILNWFNNGIYDNWKKIKFTRNGLLGNYYGSLVITDQHEFFNPIKNIYVKCSELKQNDFVLICRKKRFINYLQKQILIGKMIGDGSLSNNSIEFSHKKNHERYIDYTLKLLGDIAGNKQKEQISGYGTLMCRARTISDLSISEIFNDWLIYGNKEIPLQINLSPIGLDSKISFFFLHTIHSIYIKSYIFILLFEFFFSNLQISLCYSYLLLPIFNLFFPIFF